MKKIVLATGIFPPDIGGPAIYSRHLAEEFSKTGLAVSVITYGKNFSSTSQYGISGVSRKWPSGFRQFIYLIKLFWLSIGADGIMAFDSLGAGLPAAIAGKILNKKVVTRLGGDFLLEKFIEEKEELATIKEFYERKLWRSYPLLKKLIGVALRNSDLVAFNTDYQKELFKKNYDLDSKRFLVIGGVFRAAKREEIISHQENPRIILWAGRFLKSKNLKFLIAVFKRLLDKDPNLVLKLVGDGPEKPAIFNFIHRTGLEKKVFIAAGMPSADLNEEIKKSYFCALASFGDFGPNFIFQCLSLVKPVLLSGEIGFRGQFPGLLYADPKNEDDFLASAVKLLDERFYSAYQEDILKINYRKTWPEAAREYLDLFAK